MKILNILITLTALSVFSGSAFSATDDTDDILILTSKWTAQLQSDDIELLDDFYASDAVMLPPTSEILSSEEAIEGYWESLKKAGFTEYYIYPVSLRIEGDIAYQTALWEANRYTSSGETISLQGNISNVLIKLADGTWKIKLQSWN